MKYSFLCIIYIISSCVSAFAQTKSEKQSTDTSGPVVEMDPYIVKSDRILPNPEQWTYIKVPALILERGNRNIVTPGYEMLSNLNSGATKTLVEELQLRQFAAAYLWPMLIQALPRTPVYTVVDIGAQFGPSIPIVKLSDTWEGETIIAANATPASSNFNSFREFGTGRSTSASNFAAEYGMSAMDDMNPDISINADEDMNNLGEQTNTKAEKFVRDQNVVRPLRDGYVILASNGGPLAALLRAGDEFAGGTRPTEEQLAATLSYELSRFALSTFPQKLPPWFIRGLGNLLGSTQVSQQLIRFALVREDLAGRSMPSLSALMKKGSTFTEEEQRTASLFVHFGLFGDNGTYTARFMQLVNRLGAGEAPTDDMFKEVFKLSIRRMETRLAAYARDMGFYKSIEISGDIPKMPKPVYRDATQSEVARIKGEMYISQANPGKALEELRIAYWRGEREPAMLAMLGALELQIGAEPRARKIIKTLMELPAPPSQAYITATRIQFKDIIAFKPAGATISAEDSSALIGTLSGALIAGLTNEDLCSTLAEIVLKSADRQDANMLGFLTQAAKRYPRNKTIAEAISAAGA